MTTEQRSKPDTRKPRIVLTAEDHERLYTLARTASDAVQDAAMALTAELDRAHILARGRYPEHTVFMGCQVEFRDDTTGKVQTVTLVYPGEADIAQGKISVLTPIGAALIGLRAGHSISWETRSGDIKRLTVLTVREPSPA